VDVGTSTVAGYLCDLTDGSVVTTASMMNPQVVYGEDVMSRISYTMAHPEGLEHMNKAIVDGLNGIVEEASGLAGIKRTDILDVTIEELVCFLEDFARWPELPPPEVCRCWRPGRRGYHLAAQLKPDHKYYRESGLCNC
jgi:hypothetical protein